MAAARMLRSSGPFGRSNDVFSNSTASEMVYRARAVMCVKKAGMSSFSERKKLPVAVKAGGGGCVVVSEPETEKGVDLGLLLRNVCDVIMCNWMRFISKEWVWRFNFQMFIEKVIIDCRFMTLLAVGGSLLSSLLCFVEGCVLILESYFQYFRALSQISQQGHTFLLLIEAIDMFLVGTAMLIFGMSLHVIFVGSNNLKGSQHSSSTLSKNFSFEKLLGIETVAQAKTKIGHAVIMILQVGVLEKFKSIPINNGIDFACLAGALFLSSASTFVLSRVGVSHAEARM